MRTILLAVIILTALAAGLTAEDFRLGVTGAAEFADRPSCGDFFDSLADNTDLFPGLYWEVIPRRLGFGGTYLVRFLHDDDAAGRDWAFEWIATMDLRYHFLKKSLFDPFVELGLGCAGRVEFSADDHYYSHPVAQDEYLDVLELALFAQAGAGVALRLDGFHVGGRLVYRFLTDAIPGTDIVEFPLNRFEAALFAGFSF